MADRDDKDTSYGGSQGGRGTSTSSGGSAGSARNDTPSSGRSNGGLGNSGGGYGGSPGGGSSGGGYGWGGGGGSSAGSARSDTPSSGRSNGGLGSGSGGGSVGGRETSHSVERGIDRSLGTSTPTGFQGGGNSVGRSISTPATGRDQVGTNPGGAHAIERGQDFSLGRSLPTTTARVGVQPATGFDPTQIGGTIRSTLNAPISFDLHNRSRMTPAMTGIGLDAPGTSMAGTETAPAARGLGMSMAGTEVAPTGFGAAVTGPTEAQIDAAQKARESDWQSMSDLDNALLDGVVDKMIKAESAYDPKAKNKRSTATGLGQFLSGTWMDLIDKVRPDLAHLSPAQKLALRTDPTISRQMTKAYASDNIDFLNKNGITATAGAIYAAHHFGPQGAVNAYKASPTKSAVSVLGSDVVKSNPYMSGKTIGQVIDIVEGKMKGALTAQNMGSSPDINFDATSSAPVPTSPPATSSGGVPTPTPAPRGTEAAAGGTVTTTAAPPGTQGFPATPPKEAQAPGFPSFKTPATDYKRGLGASVAAPVIDAVLGLGGPVGLALQAGAFMLTGDTAGGTMVDMVGGKYGPNQYAPGKDDKYSGDRAGGAGSGKQNSTGVNKPETISQTPITKPGENKTTSPTPTAQEFIATYIDPTPRPTPFQQWGDEFGWRTDNASV